MPAAAEIPKPTAKLPSIESVRGLACSAYLPFLKLVPQHFICREEYRTSPVLIQMANQKMQPQIQRDRPGEGQSRRSGNASKDELE
jgi:hypothetical protein